MSTANAVSVPAAWQAVFVYSSISVLAKALNCFVGRRSYHCYRETLRNVTPADVYCGRRDESPAEERRSSLLLAHLTHWCHILDFQGAF
jgi:hypothetical protein